MEVIMLADGMCRTVSADDCPVLDCDDMLIVGDGGEGETFFDRVVGEIEDIIMDETFLELQSEFYRRYCHIFDGMEENRREIFDQYVKTFEGIIETELSRRMPDFDMSVFRDMLGSREEEVCGDVQEILASFSDFLVFKDIMMSHNSALACEQCEESGSSCEMPDFFGLGVTVIPLAFHGEML